MNPDFLKKLAAITAALRSGITLGGDPLGELQKRATQFGEGVGQQLEHDKAVANYAHATGSERAKREAAVNAAMMALGMKFPEGESIASENPAAIKIGSKLYRAQTHGDAVANLSKAEYEAPGKWREGFVTESGKFVSREAAYKIAEANLSKPVKAQIATRAQQGDHPATLTAEDLKGKLYANRGTKADEPMTLEDMDRIVAEAKARKAGKASLDSAVTLGSRLHDALSKNGGFTVDPETGADLTSGYSVGGEKSGVLLKKPLADLQPQELQSFLDQNKSKLQPGQAWGGWVDNGHAYIEPADQISDLNEAQRVGNERGEKAIWDHAAKAEIPLKAQKAADVATKQQDFNDILNKWQTAWGGLEATGSKIADLHNVRRSELADALRNPTTPEAPWLSKYMQQDIPRPNGASPQKIADVEGLAHDTFNSPRFKQWLAEGKGMGGWYDTRASMGRAIDALGDKLGPQAFNDFIDHVAASTAMSRPENNIRRASWWRALNLSGKLDPQELRTSTLDAPEGMGHIAQRAHHFAVADLAETGKLNVLSNPKPGAFAENLKMNWRPYTNDTRMATATLQAEPKMSVGLAGTPTDATPRKWAYAPMERAAQSAAAEAHARGDVDPVPAGVDPTAAWQAQVWGGIGKEGNRGMGLKPSQFAGNFNDILDKLISRSAKLWGVDQTTANELFWKGHPLDLPLDAELLKGPARPRKK